MDTIAKITGLRVGYSDHTLGIAVGPAAVAMGATILEKHFTLDRNFQGPDHKASLEPEELETMIKNVREIEAALGNPEKRPTDSEQEMRTLARRSLAAARDLSVGTIITASDLVTLRPATGIPPRDFDMVIGRSVLKNVEAGNILQWSDLS